MNKPPAWMVGLCMWISGFAIGTLAMKPTIDRGHKQFQKMHANYEEMHAACKELIKANKRLETAFKSVNEDFNILLEAFNRLKAESAGEEDQVI